MFLLKYLLGITLIRECFPRVPGANVIDGSVGASLARDEAHERVMSLGLQFCHPVHPTLENVQTMCESAPILCGNQENVQK